MTALNGTFNPDVVTSISLGSLAPTTDAIGRCLLIVPKATNGLNSQRTASYLTYAEALAAKTAGYISAATLKGIGVVFSQLNVPAQGVLVGNVDLVGSETYAEALLAIIAEDPDFFLVVINSRSSTDIEGVSAQVEILNDKAAAADAGVPYKLCFFEAQSADTKIGRAHV
mgnify:CR=1 FL=1